MNRWARRTAGAGRLPSVLLGLWSLLIVLLGTAPAVAGAPPAAALPAASAPAQSPAASLPGRGSPGAPQARLPERGGSDAAVQRTAPAEHSVRLPAAPPALAGAAYTAPPPLRGTLCADGSGERAPPHASHGPGHPRGPPSTRHG
ncbi:hypothetical protein [Streptomyces sp. NPDC005805]|uniref:hypothetical protein n=1 Tax=Streptomyces sp. NPDC005805 TaxID=3157068 RepID=UPI0033DFF7D3